MTSDDNASDRYYDARTPCQTRNARELCAGDFFFPLSVTNGRRQHGFAFTRSAETHCWIVVSAAALSSTGVLRRGRKKRKHKAPTSPARRKSKTAQRSARIGSRSCPETIAICVKQFKPSPPNRFNSKNKLNLLDTPHVNPRLDAANF